MRLYISSSDFCVKEALEYYKFGIKYSMHDIICESSITVLEAAIWVACDKCIVIVNVKNRFFA